MPFRRDFQEKIRRRKILIMKTGTERDQTLVRRAAIDLIPIDVFEFLIQEGLDTNAPSDSLEVFIKTF